MVQICLAGYLVLLGAAALSDACARRIPNWLTGGLVALYPLYVLASPTAVPWATALMAAAAVLLVGVVLFAARVLGGGDVKLITAVTLFAGLDHLALFAAVTSLTGGALALALLLLRPWSGLIGAQLTALGLVGRLRAAEAPPPAGHGHAAASTNPAGQGLPYGIAIAAGGLAVALELMIR